MDAIYKPIEQQADKLQHMMRDFIDAGDGTDNDLAVQAHEIMTCIQSEQGLRNVESRIVDLQHRLQQHYDDTSQGAISPQNARMMVDNYERLRRDVRGLPHY